MKYLTIRNLPPEVSRALDKEKRRRGTSLTQTVIELLAQGLGVASSRSRQNGLRGLAGTWTEEEHAQFEEAIAATEQVDAELWR